MLASVSILERRRSGTKPEPGLKCAMFWRESQGFQTQQPKGPGIPDEEQRIKVLIASGKRSVRSQTIGEDVSQAPVASFPLVRDVKSAWLLFLHCACARANCLLRVVRPSAAANLAETHDRAVRKCLANILTTNFSKCDATIQMPPRCRLHWVGLVVSEKTRVSVVLLIGPVGQTANP